MREIVAQPWAIMASALERIAAMEPTAAELEAVLGRGRQAMASGAIAVIPIVGVIRPKPDAIEEMFGISFGTTLASFMGQFRAAMADDAVKAVVLDVDSPGGMAAGVAEAADEMHELRKRKKVVAVANSTMASAAYWLASQAHEIVGSQSAQVGSIGVLAAHQDLTALAEREGVKVTLISAGKHKTEGHPLEPLTDEARAHIQALVDEQYAYFVKAIASGRNVSQKAVRDGYGEGRVLGPNAALSAGMIDRVGTLRETIAKLGGAASDGMRAEAIFMCKIGGHAMGVAPAFFCGHDVDHLVARGIEEPPPHCAQCCPIEAEAMEEEDRVIHIDRARRKFALLRRT
jgi:signal peptide peptidase SppA